MPVEPTRKFEPYADGELEIILSLVPTETNIAHLARLLRRSESAITIVYRIAYGGLVPGGDKRGAQVRKIRAAKKRLAIAV